MNKVSMSATIEWNLMACLREVCFGKKWFWLIGCEATFT